MHKVICDCDNTLGVPGKPIDDGQTLLYLFGRSDIELLGVTTTFGNGTIDEVFGATERLLHDAGRANLPLFRGEGRRGEPPTAAARFLAETAAAHPGEINLLAIGPVGNLRAAAEVDPNFFRNLKQITCMGGYLERLHIPGWEKVPELNLSRDPEGAVAVLHAPCPVTLMNAQACLWAPFGLPELARAAHWSGSRVYRAMHEYLLHCGQQHVSPQDYLWDVLPAVYISHPELFDANPVWVRAALENLETGAIVECVPGQGAHINMPNHILGIERFYSLFYAAWARVSLDE